MRPRFRLLIFPVLSIILLTAIVAANWPLMAKDSGSVIHLWTDSLLAGNPGPGEISHTVRTMPELELLPGDILLGGYKHCSYGRYTHMALYAGEGEVIEAFMDLGVVRQDMEHFATYDYYAILRPRVDDAVKAAAVADAAAECGKIFYPLVFKPGDRYYNCSKIIWKAYARQGVDLDPIGDLWVAPESFARSPLAEVLYER